MAWFSKAGVRGELAGLVRDHQVGGEVAAAHDHRVPFGRDVVVRQVRASNAEAVRGTAREIRPSERGLRGGGLRTEVPQRISLS